MCSKVYLGYEDDPIPEKSIQTLNFQTNKIGGVPNWAVENCQYISRCNLCGLHRSLVVQCYAPLENSQYHRTLYIFACLNPPCWNVSEGWECIRCQLPDTKYSSPTCTAVFPQCTGESIELGWCAGADDWNDDDFKNGNMNVEENTCFASCTDMISENVIDEKGAIDQINSNLKQLSVREFDGEENKETKIDQAFADIEVDEEGGPVLVEANSSKCATDLKSLLLQDMELSFDLKLTLQEKPIVFKPKYIAVEEEQNAPVSFGNDEKIDALLNKYKMEHQEDIDSLAVQNKKTPSKPSSKTLEEQYEEVAPIHGDKMFHHFYNVLKKNPEQILRYSRSAPPLLGATIDVKKVDQWKLSKCDKCNSKRICEIQLLPRIIDSISAEQQLPDKGLLSVLVYTCHESCWDDSDSFVREYVVFQPEVI